MDIFYFAKEMGIYLSGIITGCVLGAVYDSIRVVRAVIPHGKVLTFAGDFLYVLFFSFVLFTFSTGLTGEIRYFTLFGMLLGCLLERLLLGNFIVKAVRKISGFVREKILKPPVIFMTKIVGKIKRGFVKNA